VSVVTDTLVICTYFRNMDTVATIKGLLEEESVLQATLDYLQGRLKVVRDQLGEGSRGNGAPVTQPAPLPPPVGPHAAKPSLDEMKLADAIECYLDWERYHGRTTLTWGDVERELKRHRIRKGQGDLVNPHFLWKNMTITIPANSPKRWKYCCTYGDDHYTRFDTIELTTKRTHFP
jgi:hypothetical protein